MVALELVLGMTRGAPTSLERTGRAWRRQSAPRLMNPKISAPYW